MLLESIDPKIRDRRILVACSGGPDSTALISLLAESFSDHCEKLGIAHVNYHLRAVDSESDEAWVKQQAEQTGIRFHVLSSHYTSSQGNLQAWARKQRLDFFHQLAELYGYHYIALGHNLSDQAETIIDHLTRGSGLCGLCSMKLKENRIIRPLLSVSRAEIISYLNSINLGYRTDSSNQSLTYTRNQIRHRVMPELRQLNPESDTHLCQNAVILQKIKTHLDQSLSEHIQRCLIQRTREMAKYRITLFTILPQTLWPELIRYLISDWDPSIRDIQFHQINQMVEFLQYKSTFHAELKGQIYFQKNREYFVISRPAEISAMIISEPGTYHFLHRRIVIGEVLIQDLPHPFVYLNPCQTIIYLKREPSIFPFQLTNDYRRLYFTLPGSMQQARISDVLRDHHIPLLEKNRLIYCVKNQHVFYYEKGILSGEYRIDSATTHCLTLHITEENL